MSGTIPHVRGSSISRYANLALARLPYAPAQRLWLALNLVFLGLTTWLLVRLASLPARWPLLLAGAIAVGLFPPVHIALRLGQVSPLLLLLCTGSLYLILRPDPSPGKDAADGILIALATMVKVSPGLLPVYLAATKRWRILAYALLGLGACLLLGIIWGGGPSNTVSYFRTVLPALYMASAWRSSIRMTRRCRPFFTRLFTPASYPVALLSKDDWRAITFTPLVNSQILAEAASWGSTGLLLLATGLAGLRAATRERLALVLAMALLGSLLIVSCAFYHMYVLLLLPLALLVRHSCRLPHRGLLALALVIYILAAMQRYANWLVFWTHSAWLAAFGLYAALLLWGALFRLAWRQERYSSSTMR